MPERSARDGTGFIGAGVMGSAMARRAVEGGYPTAAFDLDPARLEPLAADGVTAAPSLAALLASSEIVVLSLPGPGAVETVVDGDDGLTEHAHPGTVVVDTSTIDPFTSRRMADAADSADLRYLAAPVIGGEPAARNGTLTMVVGGDEEAYGVAEGLLRRFASDLTHVGEPGIATTLKLVNNLMSLTNTVTLMEALTLAERAGAPASTVYEVLRTGSGFSAAFERRWTKHLSTGDYRAGFSVDLALKDLGLVQDVAAQLSVPTFMSATAIQMFRLLQLLGMGADDVASLARYWEDVAEVRFGPS